jgi:hypothetical protein
VPRPATEVAAAREGRRRRGRGSADRPDGRAGGAADTGVAGAADTSAGGRAGAAPRLMPRDLSPATRRLACWIIAGASLVMLLVLTQGRPWELFARGAFTSDFYDAQADSFTQWRLDVEPDVASIEGIVQGDETHLYYGVFLAVLRLPVAVVTDELAGRLARLSILVAYALGLVFSVHLAQAARAVVARATAPGDRRHLDVDPDPDRGDGRGPVAALVLAMAASPALYLGGWITVYHETELWAATWAVAALACSFRVLTDPAPRWGYLACGAGALCLLTRAPTGGAVIAAVFLALLVASWPRVTRMIGPALVAVLGLVVHVTVNLGRFGTALSVPFDDQLATRTDARRFDWLSEHGLFDVAFIPSTLVAYLRPDALRIERVVPFVRFGPPATELGSIEFESNTPTTSLTLSATLLTILAVAGVVWAVRRRQWAVLGVLVLTGIGVGPTLGIGFVANRYLVDFLPPMAAAAALGVWSLRTTRRRAAGITLAGLAAWGLAVNVALAVWTAQVLSPRFFDERFELDAAVFPAPSPGIAPLDAIDHDDTPFGTLGVDRGPDGGEPCHGVYVIEMTGISAVERTDGDRRLARAVTFGDDATIVDNGTWTLRLHADGELVLTTPDYETPVTNVEAEPGDELEVEVVADPVTGERHVDVNGRTTFLAEDVYDGRGLAPDAVEPGPLCETASERMTSGG